MEEGTEFMSEEDLTRALEAAEKHENSEFTQDMPSEGTLKQLVPKSGLKEMFEGLLTKQEISVETDPDEMALPSSVDLRRFCSAVDNQESEGVCTAHASINCLQFVMNKETGKKYDLSEWYHWLNYQKYNSWSAATSLCNFWQLPESNWPNYVNNGVGDFENEKLATLRNPKELTTVQAGKAWLAQGNPVMLSCGLDVSQWRSPVILPDRGTMKSGHAIMLCGYKDDEKWPGGGYFILMNSWGANYGDKGFQYISYSYFTSNKFYTNLIAFDKDVVWKPGKKPGGNNYGVDLKAVMYKKYDYTPASGRVHKAYGVTLTGADESRVKNVKYTINNALPTWKDEKEFEATFGTWAQSGWVAGTASVTLDNGTQFELEIRVP